MPTYDYVCNKCKMKESQYHSITEHKLKNTPTCDKCKKEMIRVISAPALYFKNGGSTGVEKSR